MNAHSLLTAEQLKNKELVDWLKIVAALGHDAARQLEHAQRSCNHVLLDGDSCCAICGTLLFQGD